MSTRSYIGMIDSDGSIRVVYCHHDGYPDGVGKTLLEHYTDSPKVGQLIALGDLSAVGREIGTKHDFDALTYNECFAYHRDRGEEFNQRHFESVKQYAAEVDLHIEWRYLWNDGAWYGIKGRGEDRDPIPEWKTIPELIEEDSKET